ncbi:MAG: CFI-box-CTERM domain-containing protein [Planctomycetota bacterium]
MKRRKKDKTPAESASETPENQPVERTSEESAEAASFDTGPLRPGPHGAEARTTAEEEQIRAAYERAARESRRGFQEITPKPVTAAEAVSSLTTEDQGVKAKPHKSRACFVATAAYGDPDAPEVERLRRFRDERLLTNPVGTAFVKAYYKMSPPIARLIARHPSLRTAVRKTLNAMFSRAAL